MAFLIVAGVLPAAAGENTWARRAEMDLTAVRDLINANHPGAVDPDNPEFRVWLASGYRQALAASLRASTQADYDRVLSQYLNGFKDGHLDWWFTQPPDRVWPGFLTADEPTGRTRVAVAAPDSPVPVDAELLSCEGTTASDLLRTRVHRYRTNAAIPHEALLTAPLLFVSLADDDERSRRCEFRIAATKRSVDLIWRPIENAALQQLLDVARGRTPPTPGLRQLGRVLFVSLPTFDPQDEAVERLQSLVSELERRAPEIHASSIMVLDVRGNTGGNSEWGERIAAALWGAASVNAALASFDWTTQWRTSALNAELTRQAAAHARAAGLTQDAEDRARIADELDAARRRGEPLLTVADAPVNEASRLQASPFSGKVYFLTDGFCASACLDFADLVLRLPGVVHVGLPTSADAVYIDNVATDLPSGLSRFTWSVKVYLNRVRGNNEWYEPAVRWPGGTMSDQAIANWLAALADGGTSEIDLESTDGSVLPQGHLRRAGR